VTVRWSAYSRRFDTARGDHLLYNALSNSLLQLDDAHASIADDLSDACPGEEPTLSAASEALEDKFLAALRERLVLVAPGDEEDALLVDRHRRITAAYATGVLSLTICPTLACNFRCPYCFEHAQQDGATMSDETAEDLLTFVRTHTDARRLAVTWYGGEPTLAWDRVRDLTERFRSLDIEYLPAALVTNGSLLDASRIKDLDELSIRSIQVTLDGPAEIHDARRTLAGGGATYDLIVANLDALVSSQWEGRLSIRVNVDHGNADRFVETREALLQRWPADAVRVYAGHVSLDHDAKPAGACALSTSEWAEHTLGLYTEHSLLPPRGFYPRRHPAGCVATAAAAYVVGPRGELYDCWEDVGRADLCVGNVASDPALTQLGLHAAYGLGTDPYNDPDCLACHALPICDGGCANRRLRRQRGELALEVCSPYKDHLEAYLEAYFDAFVGRELCSAVLTPGPPATWNGWRDVTPAAHPDVLAPGLSPLDED
jgi:uncharacterized protein